MENKMTVTSASPKVNINLADGHPIELWINGRHKTFGITSKGTGALTHETLEAVKEVVEAAHAFEMALDAISAKYSK